MNLKKDDEPDWRVRGKSVRQLIKELQTFEDDGLEVKISIDYGDTFYPISLVGRFNGDTDNPHAGLIFSVSVNE
jgi:hypothetical protein